MILPDCEIIEIEGRYGRAKGASTVRMKWKNRLVNFWKEWGRGLLLVLAIMIPLRASLADWNDVPTGSMRPTILVGDRIFVNKLAYDLRVPLTTWRLARWAEPKRGDIVVCFSPEDGKRLVKRVVGEPGDTVAMRNNKLFVNGEAVRYKPLDEDAAGGLPEDGAAKRILVQEELGGTWHPVMFTPSIPARRFFGPVEVPEGHYYVLGDNRDNSADSRYFGFVERNQIVGRSGTVVFSRNPDNHHFPRKNRWFKHLP